MCYSIRNVILGPNTMKTYTLDQLRNFTSEQINDIQRPIDIDAQNYADSYKEALKFLSPEDFAQLKEYFTDTMEKYRLIYKAIVQTFKNEHNAGYPEFIYNIDLKDGSIETNKSGRRCQYFTRHLAPCNTSMLHYLNIESNDVFVILPPIKSIERTIEKLISECNPEYKAHSNEQINQSLNIYNEEEPELPFNITSPTCPGALDLYSNKEDKKDNFLLNIAKYEILPKDIYRLTITSKYRGDIEKLIKTMEEKFPSYIKFEKGERNLYKKDIKDNPRYYFDIKKTAQITIPGTNRKFYIEFQFKQTCMFFSHIRSHQAYEEYRVLDAKYQALKESINKKKTTSQESKSKLLQLKKQVEKQKILCVNIHKSAVHQSNLNLMHKLAWINENANGLHEKTDVENLLKENYIVESNEPFDGATAFTTNQDEYLNKCHYLKLIGVLPENFDEFSKTAKSTVQKEWKELSDTDLADFSSITTMAIKYQAEIRNLQKHNHDKHNLGHDEILNLISENTR